MMIAQLSGVIGSGVPSVVAPLGLSTTVMVVGLGMLVATVLAIAIGSWRGRATSPAVGPYRSFLAKRDGEADLSRHRLARREELFDRLARQPVQSTARIDQIAFRRNLARRRPERNLDARMLWLLATAKANQAERFGVGLAELYGRITPNDPVRVHIALQEFYHTRILADVVAIFGLPVHMGPPPLVARLIVKTIVGTPEAWHLPLTGSAEMAGCTIFRALRDRGVELFADEPAVVARIRLLYDEILADEIGHVGFIAAQLGPARRALMRALYRALGARVAAQMPELVALLGATELRRRFRAPFRLDAMAAELPGIAFAAATV